MIDLNEAAKRLSDKSNDCVMNRLKSCSTSLMETVEAFIAYAFDNDLKCEFEERLSDAVFSILAVAGKENIDIEKLLEERLK